MHATLICFTVVSYFKYMLRLKRFFIWCTYEILSGNADQIKLPSTCVAIFFLPFEVIFIVAQDIFMKLMKPSQTSVSPNLKETGHAEHFVNCIGFT